MLGVTVSGFLTLGACGKAAGPQGVPPPPQVSVAQVLEKRVKVFFVTHQYEFAQSIYEKKMPNALFLRAERKAGGERTFRVVEGEPLQTSYGEDLYDRIFLGMAPSPASAAPMTSCCRMPQPTRSCWVWNTETA